MEYKVLAEETVTGLELEVNAAIQEGWKPRGGITVKDEGSGHYLYLQAMISNRNS